MYSPTFLTSTFRTRIAQLRSALLALLIVTAGAANGNPLPDIGDSSGSVMTPTQERRLGQAFMRNVRKSMTVMNDPLLNAYIESLGERLGSNSEGGSQPFTFYWVDDPSVNAFAGPGGYIGVHTGLILTTESESELAAVLAHEIAHVTQKHLLRTFQVADNTSLSTAAILIAAVVLGAASHNQDVGMAAIAGAQAGIAQRQINFTRDNEKEADRIGIQTTVSAGFDPRAMPVFFERMGKSNRYYDNKELPEFLRTHPITTNRIADSRNRAESYSYRQYPDSTEYHLARVTIRERQFKNPNEAVRHFESTLKEGRYQNEEAQRYGLVRALIRAHDYARAKKELAVLQRKAPTRIHYLALEAEILSKSGQRRESLEILRDGLALYPNNYPLSIYYGQALLDAGQPEKAQQILEKLARTRPMDTELYKLLAQAASDAGRPDEGHQYMAEYYYNSGELESAVKQLEIALDSNSRDYYRSAQMAARLKEIRQEVADINEQE